MIWILAAIAVSAVILGILVWFNIVDIRVAAATIALLLAINCTSAAMNFYSQVGDTEILNGEIVSKSKWKFSCPTNTMNPCRNGYSCHCHTVCTGKGRNRSCTRKCDTCYTYPWEQNWYVQSNIFSQMEISRVDSQGAAEPPRWTIVQKGDPASITHSYINWIKGVSNSLFHQKPEEYDLYVNKVPTYPIDIFDYYKINRVFGIDIGIDSNKWNLALSNTLRELGPKKQANVIVFFYNGLGDNFPEIVRHQWRGFKKNDIIVFMGFSGDLLTDVSIKSWAEKDMFNVVLRDDLNEAFSNMNVKDIDIDKFMAIINDDVSKEFTRKPMASYEYLKAEVGYTSAVWWVLLVTIIIGFIAAIFISRNINLRRY